MTTAMRSGYVQARQDQITRNEARRIKTKVNDARNNTSDAGCRWPFELLQNAIDAGPRTGSDTINIKLACTGDVVTFEHDGMPFTVQDLAALLSGGSSKEFESEDKTGRFGTGFLVTHVLAEKTLLQGVIAGNLGFEHFALTLDRRGNEESILANIRQCEVDLELATRLDSLDSLPSARFEYTVDRQAEFHEGLKAFQDALPYLFSTRSRLGAVEISQNSNRQSWRVVATNEASIGDSGVVVDRLIEMICGDSPPMKFRSLRFQGTNESRSACMVLLRFEEERWRFIPPGSKFPRVFREYPISGSHFVPTNVVFDGKFDVTQERDRLSMKQDDKDLIKLAFDSIIHAVTLSVEENWNDRQLLCSLYPARGSFGSSDEEIEWWTHEAARVADALARLPIIPTSAGLGSAITAADNGWFVDFPVPRLESTSTTDETTFDRIWKLVNEAEELYPPTYEVAEDWCRIAQGWKSLGVECNQVTVVSLGEWVKKDVKSLEQLPVASDKTDWLSRFIDVVGECWHKRGGRNAEILDGLLPNQHNVLCGVNALRRDQGLNGSLKDVASNLGYDVRSILLSVELASDSLSEERKYCSEAIRGAVPTIMTEGQVLQELVLHLEKLFPSGEKIRKGQEPVFSATIALLDYLYVSPVPDASSIAKKLPMLTQEEKLIRWTVERMLIAPPVTWEPIAQQFAAAYPPSRILDSMYGGIRADEAPGPNVSHQLVKWGIAVAGPLHEEMPAELKDKGLASICLDPNAAADATVSGVSFSQIALLRSAIMNRVEVDREAAKALLGMVLCYIAPNDPQWRAFKPVKAKRGPSEVELNVRGALWVADLKSRAWIPTDDKDGNIAGADPQTLIKLLEPKWLENNNPAIQLLSECFGFDALELRLLGVAPADADRQALRNEIARLVETAGADPATYAGLRQDLLAKSKRERDIQRCQKIGYAVQAAVAMALAAHNLHIEVIDHGFDLAVGDPEAVDFDDLTTWLEIGAKLLEIKATRTGDACMTPTQAMAAATQSERYSLCVVDLRGIPEERLDGDWTAADVLPIAKVVNTIGQTIKTTCQLVVHACNQPVNIRNEGSLRYNAKPSVWEAGVSIDSWIKETFPRE